MPTPLEKVTRMRRQAVMRLFETKFINPTRITVGSATCENAAGAGPVYDRFAELLAGVKMPVSLSRVGCTGRCDLEPVVTVVSQGKIPVKYIKVTPARAEKIFEQHLRGGKIVEEFTMRQAAKRPLTGKVVGVCGGMHCRKGEGIKEAFQKAIEQHGLQGQVAVTTSACYGLCERGPNAFVYPDGVLYQKLTPEKAARIAEQHLKNDRPVAEYAWGGKRIANRFLPLYGDESFFGKQLRLTLRNCGVIDPESLDEYIAVEGYEALAKVLSDRTPRQVVDAVVQ